MRLNDQVAVVTGGGRGIGKAIALRLAQEGAHLVLTGPEADELNETADQIEASGRQTLVMRADVTVEEDVVRMAQETLAKFDHVDILVNNAGVIGPTASITNVTRADWDQVLAVNLTGAFLCAKSLLPNMISRRCGKIINISSIAGKVGYPLRSPYACSKWGLIGLTLTMAAEMGEHNIQVNVICPGPVEGERIQDVFERRAVELNQSVDQVRRDYIAKTLLGRLVQDEDVAVMAAFLASDEAQNITGQTLDVTAGFGI